MKPAIFTRENPCTKVHIWNCFRAASGFVAVPVVEVRARIGLNAPKYLMREKFIRMFTETGVDFYALTASGQEWLIKGLLRHLQLHPEDAPNVKHRPYAASVRRVVRKTH